MMTPSVSELADADSLVGGATTAIARLERTKGNVSSGEASISAGGANSRSGTRSGRGSGERDETESPLARDIKHEMHRPSRFSVLYDCLPHCVHVCEAMILCQQ